MLLSKLKFIFLRSLIIGMGLVIAIVAIVAIRLVIGPISLGFAKPSIEHALKSSLPDYSVSIDDVVLIWSGWDDGLDIQALQFVVKNKQGVELANLPQIAIGFETAGLMQGRLAPDSLKIIRPSLTLLRRADGSMGFGAVSSGEANYEAVLAQIINILLTRPDTGGLDRLKRVSVVDADLTIIDLAQSQDWHITGANFVVSKSDVGIDVYLQGELTSEGQTSDLELTLSYNRLKDHTSLDLAIDRLIPSAFQRDFGFWKNLAGIDIPISVDISVDAGPGFDIARVQFDLELDRGRANLPDLFAGPIGVSEGRLVGVLDRHTGVLTLDSYHLVFGGASISGKGAVRLAEEGENYQIELNIADMPFSTLARLWPTTFKPFSRGWLVRNVTDGVIRRLEGTLDLAPGFVPGEPLPQGAFTAEFEFDGLEVHYLRPMPAMSHGHGHGTFTEEKLDILVASGRVADEATGMNIDIKNGRVILDRLNVKGTHYGSVVVHASGNVSDLVYITTFEPLRFAQAYSIEPKDLGGTGEAVIKVDFPLLKKLLFDDVDLNITGSVQGFSAKILGDRTEITQGNMALLIDGSHLEAAGDLIVGGLPFEAFWSEKFNRGDGFGSDIRLQGRATSQALTEALGFTLPFLGTLGIDLRMAGSGLNITEGRGQLDFTDTGMGLEALSWDKLFGDPAFLNFDFDVEENGLDIGAFQVVSDSLNASGAANFGFNFVPNRIQLDLLSVGDNRLSADVTFGKDGTTISGKAGGQAIDFRPVINTLFSESSDIAGFNIELDLNFGQAIAHDGVVFHDLTGLLRIEDSKLRDIHLTGLLPDNSAFVVSSIPYAQETQVELYSDNAGQLIKALGIFGGADGGVMVLSAKTDTSIKAGATKGRVKISDFKVVDSPGLATVLNFSSITGLMDMMSGSGISFDRFNLGFVLDQGELKFQDAVAIGPSVGLRMGGRLFDDLSQMEVKGMIIPAYTINTIIRSVPIIGDILTGGGQEGVFGIDFVMKGEVADPEIIVNAASILAPGIIKSIFGGRPGNGAQTPSSSN